jgi:ferric-dicitrate binding protein FerR (iron transport regulator)
MLHVLARCTRWASKLYRNAHQQNPLLRALRCRKVSATESQRKPQVESRGNVVQFPQRSTSAVQPSADVEATSTPKMSSAAAAFGDVSLGLAASAVPLVMLSLLMLASSSGKSNGLITTGANQTAAAKLPGGGTVALGARSALNVSLTDQHPVPLLLEGEAIFEVPRDAPRPLIVETFLATARAAAGSKFRVKIDTSVEFELFTGVVDVFPRGADGKPAAIALKKRIPYRVPVDVRGALTASRGSVGAQPADG